MRPRALFAILIMLSMVSSNRVLAFNNFPVTSLGIENGLSNNSVRSIYQDHNGFMWFGTYDGLNRYDGYSFKVFRNKLNDSTSLPHNYIYAIHEDQQKRLWIGTGQGLAIYNNLDGSFSPVYYYDVQLRQKQKIAFNVMAIQSDNKGNVLIGTNGWGFLLRKNGEDIATQIPFKSATGIITAYNVQTICIDRQQRTWLFIRDVGLCEYDARANMVHLVNNTIANASVIEPDTKGNIWIGTYSGLYKYTVAGNAIVQHFVEAPGQLTSNSIASLCFDQKDNVWIGTEGGGLNILNTVTEKFDYMLPGEGNKNLSSESVFALQTDKEGRIWIGTLKGGVNIIDVHKGRFETITYSPLNKNSLVNNFVAAFYEGAGNKLWIGTDGGGMSIWDRQQNNFSNYSHVAGDNASLSNNSVSCIKQDYLGNTWIATFGGGINRFNPATHSFEHFKCINPNTGEENKNVWLLYEDREMNLWATTFEKGKLYRFNRQLNRFDMFDAQLNDLIAITEDHNGNLWAGNAYQLVKIDKTGKRHAVYEIGKPVRSIYEDKRNRLWVGTEGGGLILFESATGKITARYADADGLCNNAVLNILEDETGHLWLSTFNGLSRFDPATKQFKNFYQSDGLQSNQFSYSAALKLQSGELVFGGIGGFNIFYPGDIRSRDYMPSVLFTDIRVNNKPLSAASSYITKTANGQVEELEIPYNEAVFSCTFTALEYTSTEKIRYAYFLQGWDKGWNYSGTARTINYNNISEGHYVLWIKSTNAEGVWNKNREQIKIIVLPPWYRTWWAYLLYFSVAAALVYLYYTYRTRQAKLKYEIKLAHIDAEKEKEINDKRLSFFTNISHEFRTPLTLIINPVKDILKKDEETPADKHTLNIVYRNARRLLSLVDQLLIFRKADVQADNMKFSRYNFYDLCNEVYLCFVQQAKTNHLEYVFECNNKDIELYVDREKIEIALYNLVSNAIKFTPDGGRIVFRVSDDNDKVEVAISDNGYGIPGQAASRLFEKFFQAQAPNAPFKSGFGIGLYLTKHFVEAHKGTIAFTSQEGKGTTFTICLEKGREHIAHHIIHEKPQVEPVLPEEFAEEATGETGSRNPGELITDRKTILLVDDDKEIRQYLKQTLREKYNILEATDGDEAMKACQANFPDLVISDIRMGELDGIELCKRIKKDPSLNYIPVILLTGSHRPETELQSLEGGADAYITKPFDKDILLVRIENIFKSRNELQEYFFNAITLRSNTSKIAPEYKEFLEKCILIVEKHLDDEQFTVKRLTQEVGMSHSNLYKKVKLISGQSISGFIRYIRLRKAAELLIKTDTNVNQVAFQVGINDIKYFRAHFFKLFGMNPSEYIKKYRTSFNNQYHLSPKSRD